MAKRKPTKPTTSSKKSARVPKSASVNKLENVTNENKIAKTNMSVTTNAKAIMNEANVVSVNNNRKVVTNKPETSKANLEVAEDKPESSKANPEATEDKHETSKTTPEDKHETSKTNLEVVEDKPESSQTTPEAAEDKPETSKTNPEANKANPEATEDKPETSQSTLKATTHKGAKKLADAQKRNECYVPEHKEWTREKVTGKRIGTDGVMQYKVKSSGYKEENWEPVHNLVNAMEHVLDWERSSAGAAWVANIPTNQAEADQLKANIQAEYERLTGNPSFRFMKNFGRANGQAWFLLETPQVKGQVLILKDDDPYFEKQFDFDSAVHFKNLPVLTSEGDY